MAIREVYTPTTSFSSAQSMCARFGGLDQQEATIANDKPPHPMGVKVIYIAAWCHCCEFNTALDDVVKVT